MKKLITASIGSRMFDYVKQIAALGNRFAGSKAEDDAADFVSDSFGGSGFIVVKEDFPITAFYDEDSRVKVIGTDRVIPVRGMFYTVATPPDGLAGELAFVGDGSADDFKGVDLDGKIAIFHRGDENDHSPMVNRICRAAKAGAIGAIMINSAPWIYVPTLESGLFEFEKRFVQMEPKNIPAIVINSIDGAFLLEKMKTAPVSVNMLADTTLGAGRTCNVRGLKFGTELPNERILVYGHRDTAGSPGANDNGSGTVIMLELARILRELPMKRTVELMSIGAEEQLASAGSHAYIAAHQEDLQEIKASVELDMVAAGNAVCIMTGGAWPDIDIRYPEKLCAYLMDTSKELGYHFEYDYSTMATPDSGRFAAAGVPTTWIWAPNDSHYHSSEDTPDKVDANKLKAIADLMATAIYDLANAGEIKW